MRALKSREKALLGVLVVGSIAAWYLTAGGGSIGFGGGQAEKDEPGQVYGEPPLVRMDLLAHNTTEYDPKGRDLFKYYVPPPPPKKKVEKKAPPPPPPQKRFNPPPPPRPTKPKEAGPPPPNFRYLGYLGPKDAKIAVFDSGDGPPVLARVGDVVLDDFRLKEFKYDKVIFDFTDLKWEGQTAELTMTPK